MSLAKAIEEKGASGDTRKKGFKLCICVHIFYIWPICIATSLCAYIAGHRS